MDSQLTLVSPSPPVSYYLSSTDLKDTVIYAEPAVPLYRVTSDDRHIKIFGASPNHLIAVLHRRDLLCDTISFPSRRGGNGSSRSNHKAGKQVSIQRWLKRSKMPDGTIGFTFNTEYGPYVWKVTSRHRLTVFADYDLETPIATCHLYHSLPLHYPAFIIQPAGEPLRDDIAVAYIVQRYRMMLESKTLDLFVGPYSRKHLP